MGLQRVRDDWTELTDTPYIQGHEKVYGHNNELAEKLSRHKEIVKGERGMEILELKSKNFEMKNSLGGSSS